MSDKWLTLRLSGRKLDQAIDHVFFGVTHLSSYCSVCYPDAMPKDPKRVEAGKKAAATRWGEPRVIRLDDLTPAQRRLVLALVEAAREANKERSDG